MSLALVQDLQAALKAGDLAAAAQHAEALDAIAPTDEGTIGLQAALRLVSGDFRGALAHLERLPDDPDRLHAKALAHLRLGDVVAARAIYERLLRDDPADRAALARLRDMKAAPLAQHAVDKIAAVACEALRAGDLARGFRLAGETFADNVLRTTEMPSAFALPRWRGQRVDHLLVMGMAGDGDMLQFARYLPDAARRCDRMTVAVSTQLVGLLRLNGFDAISTFGSSGVQADAQIEAMLLPTAVGATYGTRGGYLKAGAPRAYGPGFHVGVNWTASDEGGNVRTVPVEMLAPLAAVPGVTYHCLVFGDRAKAAPAWMRPLPLGDYADTANAYAGLDLIITVDSSPAHLAGALNVPMWVALPSPRVDWRFETHAHKWRWYARSRLFRGPQCFDAMAARLVKRK